MNSDLYDELLRKIKVLNETAWEGRLSKGALDAWLDNFLREDEDGGQERLHALYLLTQFIYFGAKEVRELLRAVYRDLYRQPVLAEIRRRHSLTIGDGVRAEALFQSELRASRFAGVGNPSESGAHLLYYFRQENRLPKSLFADAHALPRDARDLTVTSRRTPPRQVVFIDDLCGSGKQVVDYLTQIVTELRAQSPGMTIRFFSLFMTARAATHVRDSGLFDSFGSLFLLDESFRCFADDSRHFSPCPPEVSQATAQIIARKYGRQLLPGHPLGYSNSQLLLGMSHNVPDNSLPLIWFDDPDSSWQPAFPRYQKVYE